MAVVKWDGSVAINSDGTFKLRPDGSLDVGNCCCPYGVYFGFQEQSISPIAGRWDPPVTIANVIYNNFASTDGTPDSAFAIAIDDDKNLYMAFGGYLGGPRGIAKFDPDGNLVWQHVTTQHAGAVAFDDDGNTYVSWWFGAHIRKIQANPTLTGNVADVGNILWDVDLSTAGIPNGVGGSYQITCMIVRDGKLYTLGDASGYATLGVWRLSDGHLIDWWQALGSGGRPGTLRIRNGRILLCILGPSNQYGSQAEDPFGVGAPTFPFASTFVLNQSDLSTRWAVGYPITPGHPEDGYYGTFAGDIDSHNDVYVVTNIIFDSGSGCTLKKLAASDGGEMWSAGAPIGGGLDSDMCIDDRGHIYVTQWGFGVFISDMEDGSLIDYVFSLEFSSGVFTGNTYRVVARKL